MLCTSPNPASPAGSEISVGSPSPPPPPVCATSDNESHRGRHRSNNGLGHDDYLRPLKRLKMRESSASPPSPAAVPIVNHMPATTPQQHRSSLDGVKSFSIVDILGRESPTPPSSKGSSLASPNSSFAMHPSYLNHPAIQHQFDLQNHHHHHSQSHGSTKIVRPWDHLRGPVPVRPFLPPALLHYEHRLALDYQRQIQEHLTAQAQLLRHMSMDIIPSESGSERSSSAASDCCSPEILNRNSSDSHHHRDSSTSTGSNAKQKTVNGTPLDALFQMTSKTFDEQQNESGSGKKSRSNEFVVLLLHTCTEVASY